MSEIDLSPAKLTYTVVAGDDFADTVTIKEGDPAAAVNVSGRTYTAQVRPGPDGDAVAMAIDMTQAATGKVTYRLTDAQTRSLPAGVYVWDFQQDVGGVTRTLMGGAFVIRSDVTRS